MSTPPQPPGRLPLHSRTPDGRHAILGVTLVDYLGRYEFNSLPEANAAANAMLAPQPPGTGLYGHHGGFECIVLWTDGRRFYVCIARPCRGATPEVRIGATIRRWCQRVVDQDERWRERSTERAAEAQQSPKRGRSERYQRLPLDTSERRRRERDRWMRKSDRVLWSERYQSDVLRYRRILEEYDLDDGDHSDDTTSLPPDSGPSG
jgi:hypothetical protein